MNQLPVGTRIRFLRTLDAPANEETPPKIYAYAGQLGRIVGGQTKEGYAVISDGCKHWFGASQEEFEVIQ